MIFKIYCSNAKMLFLSMFIGSIVFLLKAESEIEIIPEKKVVFLQDIKNIPDEIASYFNVQKKEANALPAEEYPQVVREFHVWMTDTMNPEWVPDLEFLAANIKLIPADNVLQKADLAYIVYKQEEQEFMVVQSCFGFGNTFFIVFLKLPSCLNGKTMTPEAGYRTFLDRYITPEATRKLPELKWSVGDRGYRGEPVSRSKITDMVYFFSETDTLCLVLPKVTYNLPARIPMPDQWFSWWHEVPKKGKPGNS